MKLTERNIEIIRFINEFGFCDVPRIGKKFGIKKTRSYAIMKKLVDSGLVNHKRILHGHPGIFYVSSAGAKYTDLPPIDKVPISQYEHQLSIISVYLKLEQQYPCASWISERHLIHEKFYDGIGKCGHISDGLLIFTDGKQVAIEVEMSIKGKNRIEKIFKNYAKQLHINEVWYYCLPKMIPRLIEQTKKLPFIKIYNLTEFLA